MLEQYNDLISKCRSINSVNAVHIAYGNTMTPFETVELADLLFVNGIHQPPALREDRRFSEKELRDTTREWIDRLRTELRLVGKREVEPFGRRDLRKSVTLYTDGNDPGDKTLVIVFPGANFRIMMPIAGLLQNLNAQTTDVMFIRDGTRSGYLQGLEELAPAIEELGAELPRVLDTSAYERVVGLGVSAGGLPILLLATQMNFDAVLTCGAGSPTHSRWNGRGRPSPTETLAKAAAAGMRGQITVAYGAQHDEDRADAEEIARCIAVTSVVVALPDQDVGHNILLPLSRRQMLPAFLAKHLGLKVSGPADRPPKVTRSPLPKPIP